MLLLKVLKVKLLGFEDLAQAVGLAAALKSFEANTTEATTKALQDAVEKARANGMAIPAPTIAAQNKKLKYLDNPIRAGRRSPWVAWRGS